MTPWLFDDPVKHVVALSGGKDSTAMALKLREMEPDQEFIYLCTPTGDELPEMLEHWANLERILGQPLVRLTNHDLKFWITEFNALPNFRHRWCTEQLKLVPTLAFLLRNRPCVQYVGLRADEESRGGLYSDEIPQRFPLRELGWTITHVINYLKARGIKIPERTDCARCWGQRIGEWFRLWRDYPAIYADAECDEERIGHTYRSPGRDSWPAALKELRKEFEMGRKIPGADKPDRPPEQVCRVCSL